MYAFTSKSLISKFVCFVATVALMFSLSSCIENSIAPTEEEELTEELTEGERWSQVPTLNHWSARANFQAMLLNNSDILVMGGYGGSSYLNDIWLSSDQGTSWNNITPTNHWDGRSAFQAVLLANNDILVMGGWDGSNLLNDVWRSSDGGRTWGQIPATSRWSARSAFQALLLNNNDILVMGGSDGSRLLNDVWRSSDGGSNWSQIPASNHWSPIGDFQALLYDNQILIIGGDLGNSEESGAVYSSADRGTNWNLVSSNRWDTSVAGTGRKAGPTGRKLFQAMVLDNKIFFFGGYSSGRNSTHYSILMSDDVGVSWTNLASRYVNYYPARHSFQAVLLKNNDVLLMGGYSFPNPSSSIINNNIWLRNFQ